MEHEHAGHRDRLKNRFLEQGLDGFEPHQILELLLFYAIPQRDTNPLAHTLIHRFGSLAAVLDAPIEELMQVDGIKKNAATLIKLQASLARRYIKDKNAPCHCYDTLEKVGNYACSLFIGVNVEQVYLIQFNNRLEMISCTMIGEGSVNQAPILPRIVCRDALKNDAAGVIVVHNHPNGTIVPSGDDVAVTHQLEAACNLVGIHFIEHIVVAGEYYTPILRREKGTARPSPFDGEEKNCFYRAYYGLDVQ